MGDYHDEGDALENVMEKMEYANESMDARQGIQQHLAQGHRLNNEELGYVREHAGHASQHNAMFFILVFSLITVQIVILQWKKKHLRSYQIVTLGGMWVIPFCMSWHQGFWRFMAAWSIFSYLNAKVVHKATAKPLKHATPRY